MNRTSSYVMTVEANDPRLPDIIANIKKSIKLWNAQQRVSELEEPKFVEYSWSGKQEVRKRAFIRVRGRLGKDNPNAKLYRQGGPLHRYTSQDIRLEHSERVDIYVQDRSVYIPVEG